MRRPTLTRWVHPRLVPLALAVTIGSPGGVLVAQTPGAPVRAARTLAESGDAAVRWGREVEQLQRAGSLRLRSSAADTMLEGRVHDRFDQYTGDVRIFGAQLVRQRTADGVQSIFGELHPSTLGISLTPKLSAEQAAVRVIAVAGRGPIGGAVPELVALPRADGAYALAWLAHARIGGDVLAIFLDAMTGDEVFRYSVLQSQAAVGTGTGVLGERKKLSTSQESGGFIASDGLRPPTLTTFDLKGNFERVFDILEGNTAPSHADFAADTDNTWTDGAIVDAHAGIGFTYDYYAARFNRHGVDDRDRPLRTIIHPADRTNPLALPSEVLGTFILNAFWCSVCGQPNDTGYLVFGEGLPARFSSGQQNVNYFAAGFDIVAHEYSHAVTTYSSNLLYFGESGALNEAFSDIMGASAEFYLVASGRSTRPADYLLGEDVFTPVSPAGRAGTRSMSDPLGYGYPDHYGIRYLGLGDNGGVHINSSIANHAFYLAIEGGTNRTSGLAVEGVGAANREQVERVFYRGFTAFLTPGATFAQARQATLRAASELYGDSSAPVRAVSQAWTAVGVN